MPTGLRRACGVATCPRAAVVRGYCQTHAQERERLRGTAHQRGYTPDWVRIRLSFLRRHPTCACGRPATDVHHLRRLREGGTHTDDNLRALCHACHSRLTAQEDSRWTGRR